MSGARGTSLQYSMNFSFIASEREAMSLPQHVDKSERERDHFAFSSMEDTVDWTLYLVT